MLRGHKGLIEDAAFSPDGSRVVTASFFDNTARLWDARDGAEINMLHGPEGGGWVVLTVFSPDGSRIVTASKDNTARLWDADNGAEIAVLRGHEDSIIDAAFSPDGSSIVTVSEDKTARLWPYFSTTQGLIDFAHCIVPRQLTKEERERYLLKPESSSEAQARSAIDSNCVWQ